MTKGIFITGTDTGVGKTYIAERIASILYGTGVNVGVMKPAETGCRDRAGQLTPKDTLRLMKAAQIDDSLDLVNPYRFRKPLAPLVAAHFEGRTISPKKIINAFQVLSRRHEFMIVEGAGGIMVPLRKDFTYLDLAHALKLPVVIVARPGLGTINHTLLTISALREKKVSVSGIVFNCAVQQPAGIAERTSPAIIAKMAKVKILGIVQHDEIDLDEIVDRL